MMQSIHKIIKLIKPVKIVQVVYENNGANETATLYDKSDLYKNLNIVQNKIKNTWKECDQFIITDSNNDFVHRCCVYNKSRFLNSIVDMKNSILLGDCATDEKYRGRGIYPYILDIINKRYAKKNKYVLVSPENTSSIRGVEKAHFKYRGHVYAYRILGFYIYKKLFKK